MSKRLLIVGASVLQLPAIKKAKEMGFYVGVVDYNPEAIGIRFADEFFNVSTNDINGVVEVAKTFKPNGIMTLATDMPMRSIAKACELCNLPGISYETALRATDKGLMIKAFEENGVEHPWYFIAANKKDFDGLLERVTYPCIMKPTDNSGSKGVVKCDNREELVKRYAYSSGASRSNSVIIEEYLTGPEFSVELMVLNGIPYVLQITDKLTTGAPFFVEMGHSQPTEQPIKQQNQIKDLAIRAALSVGIFQGPVHVEMILTAKGPRMVELGARMGGDCITTHLLPLSTGIDMVKATIELACGEEPDIKPKCQRGAAIRYLRGENTYHYKSVLGIENARKLPGVCEIVITKEPGDKLGEIKSSNDRLGFVIAEGKDAKEAVKRCEAAISALSVQYEEAE